MKWLTKYFKNDNDVPIEILKERAFFDIHYEIQDDGRAKMSMDWNDDFIKYLRKCGYFGESEEVIIQKYLATTAAQVKHNMGEDDE